MKNSASFIILQNGLFELRERLVYVFPWDNNRCVQVPYGHITNFGSIPWFGRILVSPIDPCIIWPALVHDFLTSEFDGTRLFKPEVLIRVGDDVISEKPDWNQSATILRLGMKAEGAPAWKRMVVYWSVRLYGWWKRK